MVGIICLVLAAIILYFFIIKKPSDNDTEQHNANEEDMGRQYQFDEEKTEKMIEITNKIQII